jgi:hypothetical protein
LPKVTADKAWIVWIVGALVVVGGLVAVVYLFKGKRA